MRQWLSGLLNTWKGAATRESVRVPVPHIGAVAAHNATVWPNLTDATAQSAVYARSPWVYVAVNRIAEAAALVPLHVYRVEGERKLAVENHPLERLLNAPNPFMSRFELLEQTLGMLELTGNAYWLLSGDATGTPTQIWPLRPDRVRIVPDARRFVRGYVYEIDGRQIPLEAVEVVHFKRWHPTNDYYGLSALAAARVAVQTDQAMSKWNHNTFGQNNGVPAGIVNVKEFITDSDFERLKGEWRSSYGGAQRKTAFLRGGGVEWQDIGLSHTDLDFLDGRQANRDEILSIFGVPVGLISENATEANARVAERTFIERTLWPKLVRLSQKITQELLPFWPGEHSAAFADIRPTDTQARLDEIRTAVQVLSINEIRQQYYHLQPVEWGAFPVAYTPPAEEPDAEVDTDESSSPEAVKAELARWERFALKRLGQPEARPFEAHHINAETAFELNARVQAIDDADALKVLFADARAALNES
jgi:HK97 family phage portal protein